MNQIITIILIILFFYTLFRNNDRKSKINSKIPGPIGLPILGNLTQIKTNAHLKFEEWYKKYGTIYRIRMGGIETVVLTELPTIKKAFVDNSDAFASRFQRKSRMRSHKCEGLINSNSELHSLLKKVVLSEMTATRIKKMEHHINQECECLCLLLDEHAKNGKPFKINSYFKMFSMNIILRFVLGVGFPYKQVEDSEEITNLIVKLFTAAGSPILSDFINIPYLDSLIDSDYIKYYGILVKRVIDLIIKYKNENDSDGDETIMSKLLKELDQGNITYHQLASTVIDLIVAGTDTSSNSASFCIISLINNPHIQDKLYKSISNAINEGNNSDDKDNCGDEDSIAVSYSKYRSSIPYLSMFLKETFRKYPIALLGLPHLTTEDVEIEGYVIAAGTQVIQNIYATHNSEKLFPNSQNEFNPERFIDTNPNSTHGSNSNLVHFGTGPRDCVGKALAEAELFTIIAALSKRYEFSNPNPSIPLNDVGLFGLAFQPPDSDLLVKKRINIH